MFGNIAEVSIFLGSDKCLLMSGPPGALESRLSTYLLNHQRPIAISDEDQVPASLLQPGLSAVFQDRLDRQYSP